ncbi:MAG: flagellar biosynthetic protein FliO [Caulobacterales bacterium]|nr:flagellar biosynthetic protein FliO [Caulobacterales bacterium]
MDVLDFGRYAGGLLVTLALLTAAYVGLRRFAPALSGGAIGAFGAMAARATKVEVVQTTALDARRRLTVVRFDGREHLILLGAQGETVVASASEPVTPAEAAS